MVTRVRIFGALLGVLILPLHGAIAAARAAVVLPSEATHAIVINALTARDGSVSGPIVNKSSATVRE